MLSSRQVCKLAVAFAALLILALGLGCSGFFVDPVLTSMTVGPAAVIQTGGTIQMTAVGTYNDGSQKRLTSGVYWGSGTPNIATVNSSSGIVTGIGPGQALITAAKDTMTASATVTVTIGGLTAIHVTTQDGLTNIAYGTTEQFVATGTANGVPVTITDSVIWSTSPSSIPNVSIASTTGLLTTTSGGTNIVQFDVIATDPPTGLTDRMTFTVHP
jgi:Big-like domain-containing protein